MVLIDYDKLKKTDENLTSLKISMTHKMPSERFKRRYIVLEIENIDGSCDNLDNFKKNSFKNLRYNIKNFFGIFDFSLSHFFVLKKNIKVVNDKLYLITKISNKYIEKFKSALFFFRNVDKYNIKAESVYVSGSLKKAISYLDNMSN